MGCHSAKDHHHGRAARAAVLIAIEALSFAGLALTIGHGWASTAFGVWIKTMDYRVRAATKAWRFVAGA